MKAKASHTSSALNSVLKFMAVNLVLAVMAFASYVSYVSDASAHKYYAALTDVTWNEQAQSLEFVHRFFDSDMEQALSAELGQELRIRIVEDGQAPVRTVAAAEQQQQHQAMNDAEKAIAEDPTVQTLKEKMGARVVDDSIRPIQ